MNHAIDLVSRRRWLFLVSAVLALAALVMLAIPPTFRPGIEFTSGTTMLLRFERPAEQGALRDTFADLGHPEARIQSAGPGEALIRTRELEVPANAFTEVAPVAQAAPFGPTPVPDLGTVSLGPEGASGEVVLRSATIEGATCTLGDAEVAQLAAGTEAQVLQRIEGCGEAGTLLRVLAGSETGYIPEAETHAFTPPAPAAPPASDLDPNDERARIYLELEQRFGPFEVLEFAQVSPVVSRLAVRNATIAIIVASVFIMGYIAFAFSSVPRPFLYGACAIAAMAHDVIIVLGAFSIFGKLFGTEINLMFVTGLLTIIGFSVHDTIVVFDRIRENIRLHPALTLAENVNAALLQTMARSFNTSITVLLTVLALLLLGGATIREFLLVILVGIISGAYSSVAIAAQLLVAYEEGDFGRLWGRIRGRRTEAAPSAGD